MTGRPVEYPLRFPAETAEDLAIALFEPEIPLNVGSVARTCACTGIPLYLVGPLGFRLDSRLARRGGLDYWERAKVIIQPLWADFEKTMQGRKLWLFSTKGRKTLWDTEFLGHDVLVFGSERTGLPESMLAARSDSVITIPMVDGLRSLNVSNAVAIGAFEALRQRMRRTRAD